MGDLAMSKALENRKRAENCQRSDIGQVTKEVPDREQSMSPALEKMRQANIRKVTQVIREILRHEGVIGSPDLDGKRIGKRIDEEDD